MYHSTASANLYSLMPSVLWVIFVVIFTILKLAYGRLLCSMHIINFRIFCLEFHVFWPKLMCASQQTWVCHMVSISKFWPLILMYVQTKMNPKLMFVSEQISMMQSNYLVICILADSKFWNLSKVSMLILDKSDLNVLMARSFFTMCGLATHQLRFRNFKTWNSVILAPETCL